MASPDPATQLEALRTGCGVLTPARGFVAVDGVDAGAFLQNLLTQDLAGLEDGSARAALLLTPKAKVLVDLRVTRLGAERLLLDVELEFVDLLVKQLTRYRLGSKVTIEPTRHWSLVSLIGPTAATIDLPGVRLASTLGALPRIDVIVPTIGSVGMLQAAERAGAVPVSDDAVEAIRIDAGQVRLGHDVDERWMPAEVGLVETTVSFTKGCFIGQEPVTRLHRRGHANRTPRRLASAVPLVVGTALESEGREVGVVTSVAGLPWLAEPRAIGIVRVDAEGPLTAAGSAVELLP